ncbi:hypothetical protein, partial [Campylobacter sp.]|uniref:hypothetical protein n=1 Tax=Campylobacter sp. TaxID=205 RepID=UPI002AA67298
NSSLGILVLEILVLRILVLRILVLGILEFLSIFSINSSLTILEFLGFWVLGNIFYLREF